MSQRLATKTIGTRLSNLSGQEGAGEVVFSFKDTADAVDLTEQGAEHLREQLEAYIAAARKAPHVFRRPPWTSTRAQAVLGKCSALAAVRAWGRESGHAVSARGRVPRSVLAAYDAAR